MKTARITPPFLVAVALFLGLGLLLTLGTELSGGLVSAGTKEIPATAETPNSTSNHSVSPGKAGRGLTLKQRIAYQQSIETVYWRHRIWPAVNPKPKPRLEEVMPLAQIQAKVEDSLRMSRALETYWHRPITAAQLQAELDRIASQTQQPAMLAELWTALDNDPFVIAECLARPVLVERLIRERYAADAQSQRAVNAPGAKKS